MHSTAVGRPFRDAEVVTADRVCDEAVWSAISARPKDLNAKISTADTDETSLGSEWARRAVGTLRSHPLPPSRLLSCPPGSSRLDSRLAARRAG
jgi:hypothetical protein